MAGLPQLPIELILDILEALLEQRNKLSYRSATRLAQSCSALRNSEAGRRARYAHALACLSISVPRVLPEDLEYEAELLMESRWPHRGPQSDVDEDDVGLGVSQEGYLRGTECVTLLDDCASVFTLEVDSEPTGCRVSSTSCTEEWIGAGKSPSFFPELKEYKDPLIQAMAVDEEAQYCAAVHRNKTGHNQAEYTLEVRHMRTEELALPGEQARLQFSVPPGVTDSDRFPYFCELELVGDFVLLSYNTGRFEVRRWRTESGSEAFPIAWSIERAERLDAIMTAELHSPCFLSLQLETHQDEEAEGDFGYSSMELYRLNDNSAQHIATFQMPEEMDGGDYTSYLDCGARLEPGEDGLVVIVSLGVIWLWTVSKLVEILYAAADAADGARVFDIAWVRKHMKKLDLAISDPSPVPSVSGWRCAFLLRGYRRSQGCLAGPIVEFLDTSPRSWPDNSETELSPDRCFRWGDRFPILYQHPLRRYLPARACGDGFNMLRVELSGARMLVFHRPGAADGGLAMPSLHVWKV